jgi:hypothetical protein
MINLTIHNVSVVNTRGSTLTPYILVREEVGTRIQYVDSNPIFKSLESLDMENKIFHKTPGSKLDKLYDEKPEIFHLLEQYDYTHPSLFPLDDEKRSQLQFGQAGPFHKTPGSKLDKLYDEKPEIFHLLEQYDYIHPSLFPLDDEKRSQLQFGQSRTVRRNIRVRGCAISHETPVEAAPFARTGDSEGTGDPELEEWLLEMTVNMHIAQEKENDKVKSCGCIAVVMKI